MQRITQTVFDDLFKGEYKDKLFSSPKSLEEYTILMYLLNKKEINETKAKN